MSERDPRPEDGASDDAPLGARLASVWPAAAPPSGFADRVLARRRPRRVRTALLAAGAAVSLAAALALVLRPAAVSGSASPTARTSIAIGGRGTAVAEAGAVLAFAVARGGDARVEQRDGDVFYRVERGGAFVVKTPLSEVHVKGTCFRVEVLPMDIKHSLIGAALGASTATAVAVTVYEGRVEVRSAHGAVEMGPGERLTTPAAPAPQAAPDLESRDRAQRAEIARLNARVAELERAPAAPRVVTGMFENAIELRGGPGKRPPVAGLPGENGMPKKFFDFTRDEWATMAAQCELRLQLPPFGPAGEPALLEAGEARELGFSDDERRRYNELLSATSDAHRTALAAIYKEITGDSGERLTIGALDAELRAKSVPGELSAARKRYAEERAGLATPDPAHATPVDRYVRLQAGAWEDFEGKLAALVGADKARATRERPSAARLKMAGCQ
jgi:hypothetical protein